ncbi:MAG: endopeptidase La, partial [Acidobacteria bacterium]|nr:endopeptidase La [Acidobacteriota bacterium]
HNTSMTGEITLSGLVFAVGGIKEKVLAAHRAGIRRIILPSRNEADIEEIPAEVRAELEIVLVSRISEVLDAALEKLVANPPPPPPAASMDAGARNPATGQAQPEALRVREP